MSTASKVTLGVCATVSLGIVGYVHYSQQNERSKLHEGVLRDAERQHMKRVQNIDLLQQQIDLTRQLALDRDRRMGKIDD